MSSRYFIYGSNNQVLGPYPVDEITAMLRRGEIEVNTLVCVDDGSENWLPLGDMPALSAIAREGAAAPIEKLKVEVEHWATLSPGRNLTNA